MKKMYLIGLFLFGVISVFAQQKEFSLLPAPVSYDQAHIAAYASTDQFKNTGKKKRSGSMYMRYINYLAANQSLTAANLQAGYTISYMFKDSNMRFNPPYQGYGITFKSIGQVLDPRSPIITAWLAPNDIIIGPNDSYTIDSVWIGGSYAKVTPAIDSMKMSLLHSGGNNLPEYYFTGTVATNFSTDTAKFLAQFYTPTTFNNVNQTNVVGAPAAYVTKRALTAQDSSQYTMGSTSFITKYIGFSANNFVVPAGEKVSVSFTFLPGFTWSPGDSIGKNNRFLFASYEPYGLNTFMPYFNTERNMSSTVTKDSTGWGGFYIPTLAFVQGYQQEIHDIFWKITCTTCANNGPTQNDMEDEWISDIQLYPNPGSSKVQLSLTLTNEAKQIGLSIANIQGQVVKQFNLTAEQSNHEIHRDIDISDLTKGIYLYTVTVDGHKVTDKLIVD